MRQKTAYRILTGKPQDTSRTTQITCEDNIYINLRETEIGWYGLDSSGSEQEPLAGSCEYGNEPSSSKNFGRFLSS
jgi:hypothetical protein